MSTFKEIIERVDSFKPNDFPEKTKLSWLLALDGKLGTDILLLEIEEIRALTRSYPEALHCEPLVPYPHEDLYDLWLEAKIDYANGDYDKYQNTMEHYNETYRHFSTWLLNRYHPADRNFSAARGYYITAYGLAVMQGFSGTLTEWLESLKIKGDPGKTAYAYAVEGGYAGTEEQFADHMAGNGKTAYGYAVEGGYIGTVEEFRAKMAAEYAPGNHDHDERYHTTEELAQILAGYSLSDHDHDERYHTAEELAKVLLGYAKRDHGHTASDVGALSATGPILLKEGVHYGSVFPTEGLTEGQLFLIDAESAAAAELGV